LLSQSSVDRFDVVIVNDEAKFIINNIGVLNKTLTIRRTPGQTAKAQERSFEPCRSAFRTVHYLPREQRQGMLPADA